MACFLRTDASSFCSSRTCVCKSSQSRDFSETVRAQAVASPLRFSCSWVNSSLTFFHFRSASSNLIRISSLWVFNDWACANFNRPQLSFVFNEQQYSVIQHTSSWTVANSDCSRTLVSVSLWVNSSSSLSFARHLCMSSSKSIFVCLMSSNSSWCFESLCLWLLQLEKKKVWRCLLLFKKRQDLQF